MLDKEEKEEVEEEEVEEEVEDDEREANWESADMPLDKEAAPLGMETPKPVQLAPTPAAPTLECCCCCCCCCWFLPNRFMNLFP